MNIGRLPDPDPKALLVLALRFAHRARALLELRGEDPAYVDTAIGALEDAKGELEPTGGRAA